MKKGFLAIGLIVGLMHWPTVAAQPPEPLTPLQTGYSVEKRPIPWYRLGTGEQEIVVFLGVFHGDEPQGYAMLQHLMQELQQNPQWLQGKTVYVMPRVNPDGYARKTRVNARQVDLNRNFPTRNFKSQEKGTRYYSGPQALSEPESKFVFQMLQPFLTKTYHGKVKIVSIHAPFGLINYDGPAAALASLMSRHNGMKTTADIGYPTPGSFGTYYGKERAIPVITLETPPVNGEKAWQQNRKALLAVVTGSP